MYAAAAAERRENFEWCVLDIYRIESERGRRNKNGVTFHKKLKKISNFQESFLLHSVCYINSNQFNKKMKYTILIFAILGLALAEVRPLNFYS
jgi:hypothetical protein